MLHELIVSADKRPELCLKAFKEVLFIVSADSDALLFDDGWKGSGDVICGIRD
jgi:hypothetical protein